MASPSPPAVQSIRKLTHEIILSFQNDILDISSRLLGKELISDDIQEEMLLGYHTSKKKAAILVEAVKNTIRGNPEMFEDLLNILSEHNNTISVGKKLRSTYQS
jgi:hypothetical protein